MYEFKYLYNAKLDIFIDWRSWGKGKEVLKEEFSICTQKKEVAQVFVQNKSF